MTHVSLPICDHARFKAHFDRELFAAPLITTLQINIGYVCNLACRHCHVESSPSRNLPEENMQSDTAERVVAWAIAQESIRTVDITGGSPEMNPNFRWMVESFRESGIHVIDRCNPTIIVYEDRKASVGYDWVPDFLAANQVEVIASMPCYLEENVERQRGRRAYSESVQGLLALNDAGYGKDPRLPLNLVYNPGGPHLPPAESALEADYRRELNDRFGIVFNDLYTITNMPIKRWRHELERDGHLEEYMTLLADAFNEQTIDGLMCRHQISIDPQGRIFDCDFNQALAMHTPGLERIHVWDTTAAELANRVIATDDHCYGCTAGAGSSCGGAIVD